MLEQLFGSKTRTKLLKLFLLNPDEAYFIRELTRKIDTQINSVRRELQNLEQCNIIEVVDVPVGILPSDLELDTEETPESKKKGIAEGKPKKYFRLNKDFVLYNELKHLFLKGPLLFQNQFMIEIREIPTIDYAILSGYFVERDDATVDLLVVGEVPKAKLTKLIHAFEKELEREINYTTMSTEEFLYRKSLADKFIFLLLEGKKILVVDRLFK
jgi:hypothetical protein